MIKKIRIKIKNDSKYIIKSLYRKHINIYNIEYMQNGNIYTIDRNDLEKINYEEIEILSYLGIYKILYKIKFHKYFISSIILSILTIFLCSRVVIKVEVIHSDKNVRELVLEELYNNNIRPFILKKSFNELQIIKEEIKEKYPENIEWLEIVDEGMKYTVKVEERIITKEEKIPTYCDIVSKKDATILGIKSSTGQDKVGLNDFVKKGSTLISGAISFNENVKSYTCAEGSVYGNTWYTVNTSVPFDYIDKIYTGKESKNIAFEIGSKLTNIFKVHFKKYSSEKKKLFSIGNFSLYLVTHKEYINKNERYTEEKAYQKALELGREKILVNLDKDAEILDEKVLQRNVYDSIIEVEIFYSIKELISKQVELEIPKEEKGAVENESTQ